MNPSKGRNPANELVNVQKFTGCNQVPKMGYCSLFDIIPKHTNYIVRFHHLEVNGQKFSGIFSLEKSTNILDISASTWKIITQFEGFV